MYMMRRMIHKSICSSISTSSTMICRKKLLMRRCLSDYILKHQGIERLVQGNKLRELLVKNGAMISPSVVLHDYSYQNQGLGLRACQPIQKFDTIVSIPVNLTISYANPHISSKVEDSSNDSNESENIVLLTEDEVLLAELLMHLKSFDIHSDDNVGKCLQEYLLTLFEYQDMSHLPLLWSEEKLKPLEELGVHEIVKSTKEVISLMCNSSDVNVINEASRAIAIVLSRSFSISGTKKKTEREIVTLLPFIDFANHADSSEVTDMGAIVCYNKAQKTFDLIACSNIEKDDQIFCSYFYGISTPEDMWCSYGYIDKRTICSVKNKNRESFTTMLPLTTKKKAITENNDQKKANGFIRCVSSIKSELKGVIPEKLRTKVAIALKKKIKILDDKLDTISIKKTSAPAILNDIEFLHWLEARSLQLLLEFVEWEKVVGRKTVYFEKADTTDIEKVLKFTIEFEKLKKQKIFL